MRKHRCIGLAMGLMAVIGTAQAEPLTTAGVGLASCEKLARDLKPEQDELKKIEEKLKSGLVEGTSSSAENVRKPGNGG